MQFLACKLFQGYTEMLAQLNAAEVPFSVTLFD